MRSNQYRAIWFSIMTACLAWAVFAEKSDQQVVTECAAVLGPNTYARLVWVKGGANTSANLELLGENQRTSIYVCDTKDGVRRPVAPNLPSGHLFSPSITADGLRVTFCNGSDLSVYVCDFSGTNLRKLASGYQSFKTWRDPSNKSDWVIIQSPSKRAVYQMSLLDTSKVLLKNGISGMRYGGLSVSGKYLVGGFPSYADLGVIPVPNGSIDQSMFNPQGCWPSFSKVNEDKIMYTIEPHTSIKQIQRSGSVIMTKNIFSGSGAPGPRYNALRWMNDDDLITYWPEDNNDWGGSPKMPVLMRISNLKWASLYDEATDLNASCDGYVYTGNITSVTMDRDAFLVSNSIPRQAETVVPTVSLFRLNGATENRPNMSGNRQAGGFHIVAHSTGGYSRAVLVQRSE